jgi:hypothetical protein
MKERIKIKDKRSKNNKEVKTYKQTTEEKERKKDEK